MKPRVLTGGYKVPASLFLLACLFWASPFCASARAGSPAEHDQASPGVTQVKQAAPVHLSDAESLVFAARLVSQGHMTQARGIYALLLQSRNPEIQLEAAFQLARFYIAEKRYTEAVNVLRVILNRFPHLARVRLELARAYFLDEKYDDAEFNFNLVKGGKDVPPAVVASIDRFLDGIRRKRNWSLSLGFSVIPDSNLNQASGAEQECIYTIFGLLCRDLEKEKSGVGVRASVRGNYYLKLSDNFGLRNTAGLYLTEYGGKNYDDYTLYAASGPRYLFSGGEVSLQPTYTKRWVGGKRYSDAYGLRLDGQKSFKRLIMAGGISGARNRYNNEYVDNILRGGEYGAYLAPRLFLSNQSYVQAGLAYTGNGAENPSYAYNRWQYSLGAYYFFKYGFSLSVDYSIAKDTYQAARYFITEDHFIDSATRKDATHSFNSELSTNVFARYGITPALQYNYTRRNSNIWSNEFDKHRVNMAFEFSF